MRRALLILLVFVLPLKAAAAMVVPIVGAPAAFAVAPAHHVAAHASHDAQASHHAQAADQTPCCCDDDARDQMHDHGCPHLAMAGVATDLVAFTATPTAPQRAQHASRSGPSIVLDVPCPPPTA